MTVELRRANFLACRQLAENAVEKTLERIKSMSLIRYQSPELMSWPSLDRWVSLRDDLNSLFESPFWSGVGRAGQLFSGWSPAADLYQDNDIVVAIVELPGMRREDIEIYLHDGTLT